MKLLLLCRHAKSSWKKLELADIDRPLNSRGKKNAFVMGERLIARGMIPEIILSSPAKRARKTAIRLCRAMTVSKDDLIKTDDTLYNSDIFGLLKLIHVIDDDYDRVMLIGHNPEFTQLANQLLPIEIYNIPSKYSASTPSSPDPVYSHMTQYSSQSGLDESGALSKHLQDDAHTSNLGLTRMFTIPTCGIVACSFAVNSWQHIQQTQPKFLFFDFPKQRNCNRS